MSADERMRYEAYFQQCGPVQGYLTGKFVFIIQAICKKRSTFSSAGEQAREFFVKSGLPGDILRKIW